MAGYQITFATGETAALYPVRDAGSFLIGLARRADGYCRTVFFDRDGHHDADPWVTRIDPPEVAAAREIA